MTIKKSLVWLAMLLTLLMLAAALTVAEQSDIPPFIPGDYDDADHEHEFARSYTPISETEHEYRKFCTVPTCGVIWDTRSENHTYADGVCTLCAYRCSHKDRRTETYMLDGQPRWEGIYVCYDGEKVTYCNQCGMELFREKVTERKIVHIIHDWREISVVSVSEEEHLRNLRCYECGMLLGEREKHYGEAVKPAVSDNDTETHVVMNKCSACGELFEMREKHVTTLLSITQNDSAEKHLENLRCDVCGMHFSREKEHHFVHLYWREVSDTKDEEVLRCNECGLTIVKAAEEHRYSEKPVYVSHNNKEIGTHTVCRSCEKCGYLQNTGREEAHEFVQKIYSEEDSTACKLCGQEKYHDAHRGASWSHAFYEPVNEREHVEWWQCFYCTGKSYERTGEHTYDPLTMRCTLCGYLAEGCEHTYELTCVPEGDGHVTAGTCTKCGKLFREYGSHNMTDYESEDYIRDNRTHSRKQYSRCADCGLVIDRGTYSESHRFLSEVAVTEYEITESNHSRVITYHCDICGTFDYLEVDSHQMETAAAVDQNTHTGVCTVCGYSGATGHRFICGFESAECRDCGARHDHTDLNNGYLYIEYTSCNIGRHWVHVMCSLCGREARFYGVDHEMADGVCVKCGYSRDRMVNGAENEMFKADQTALPYILSGDGIRHTAARLPLEEDGSGKRAMVLEIESSGVDGLQLHLPADWLRELSTKGVQALYIYLNDAPVLVTDSIENCLNALKDAGIDEMVLTLTRDEAAPGGYVLAAENITLPESA